MTHRRTSIRDAIVKILKDASTSADVRVYGDRVGPLFGETYPLILVYARSEQARALSSTPAPMERVLSLSVEIRTTVSEDTSIDATLDGICEQVETAINANPRLNQTVMSCNLLETEFEVSPVGDQALGGARLTYEVVYEE